MRFRESGQCRTQFCGIKGIQWICHLTHKKLHFAKKIHASRASSPFLLVGLEVQGQVRSLVIPVGQLGEAMAHLDKKVQSRPLSSASVWLKISE
jgi:hypothetical protein